MTSCSRFVNFLLNKLRFIASEMFGFCSVSLCLIAIPIRCHNTSCVAVTRICTIQPTLGNGHRDLMDSIDLSNFRRISWGK
ncbi:hypothetical protein EDD22DRAFT_1053737 [Suillus occidentalis]|nr:hypothetical protein EDD22DRAFT_1053737 [Suillus occidentalis]